MLNNTLPAKYRPSNRRGGRGLYLKALPDGKVRSSKRLPEYLEAPAIEGLLRAAPHGQARLVMLIQWRAGLRVSEALHLEVADLQLDNDRPTLKVRQGKFHKDRVVSVHPELAAAFRQVIDFGNVRRGLLVPVSRTTAWRWTKKALVKAQGLGSIPPGQWVGTHTLRHSAARHWLASGVPINVVSRWLGHASIQNTLIYLELLPDPAGFMDRVP